MIALVCELVLAPVSNKKSIVITSVDGTPTLYTWPTLFGDPQMQMRKLAFYANKTGTAVIVAGDNIRT